MSVTELPSASLAETFQFNQLVVLPNAVQGIFRRRRTPVGMATRTGVDGHAVRLVSGLRRNHAPGPFWVRVMKDRALLLLEIEDVRRVLEGSPEQFASDPPAKRRGMTHFQPDALTISRGELGRTGAASPRTSSAPGTRCTAAAIASCGRREEVAAIVAEVDREDAGVLG